MKWMLGTRSVGDGGGTKPGTVHMTSKVRIEKVHAAK